MAGPIEKKDVTYNNQLDAFELYHLILEEHDQPSSVDGGPALPALGHAISGSIATAASKLLMYPLALVITRLQVQKQLRAPNGSPSAARDANAEYEGLLDAARKIYRHEGGIRAFYTGCLPEVAKGIADSFLFFLAYNFIRQYELSKTSQKRLSVPKELAVGIGAGAFAKLITTPLQNIITRQQTAGLFTVRDPKAAGGLKEGDRLTVAEIARQIHKERGLQGFWAGYSASIILTLNPAITFTVDNFLHRLLPKLGADDSGARFTFLVAAVAKSIATSITYPVSVAKSRAQVKSGTKVSEAEGTDKGKDQSSADTSTGGRGHSKLTNVLRIFSAQYAIFVALRGIYRSEGLEGLYSGLEGEVLKGFVSHGFTMVMKDRVHIGVIRLYYTLLRLSQQWPQELQKTQIVASALLNNVQERAENVGTTLTEAGKSAVRNVTKE